MAVNKFDNIVVREKAGIGIEDPTEKLEVDGKVKATEFVGKGSEITDLNGENITTGTIDDARIPSTVARETHFDPNSGHKHTGGIGDGPKVSHRNLDGILLANHKEATTDTDGNKHVTDALAKAWQDHIITPGNPHGLTLENLGALSTNGGTISGTLQVKGNVGIGTTSPSEKLEVNGTVKAGKFVGDGSGLIKAGQWTDVGGGISYKAGNVGIGTSSPSEKLEVNGTVKAGKFVGDGSGLIKVKAGQWTDVEGGISYNDGNVGIFTADPKEALDVFGTIRLNGKNAFQGYDEFLRINQDNEFPSGTHFPHRANFQGGITTGDWWDKDLGKGNLLINGNVGIRIDDAKRTLHVEGSEIHSGGGAGGFSFANRNTGSFVDSPSNGERWVWYSVDGLARLWSGWDVLNIDINGNIEAASFTPLSDVRLKTNIMPLTDILDKLEKIRGVSFKWNELDPFGRSKGGREIGLIAQEVEEVFPELITTWGDDGYRGIDYNRFTGVLLEAIKELKAENEAFKGEIKALKDAVSRNRDA